MLDFAGHPDSSSQAHEATTIPRLTPLEKPLPLPSQPVDCKISCYQNQLIVEERLQLLSTFLRANDFFNELELSAMLPALRTQMLCGDNTLYERLDNNGLSFISRLVCRSKIESEQSQSILKLARALARNYAGLNRFNPDEVPFQTQLHRLVLANVNKPLSGLLTLIWLKESPNFNAEDIDLLFKLVSLQTEKRVESNSTVVDQTDESRYKIRQAGPKVDLFSLNAVSTEACQIANNLLTQNATPLYNFAKAIEFAALAIGIEGARIVIVSKHLPDTTWLLEFSGVNNPN